MNTNKITRERISALADGELHDLSADAALDTLCTSKGQSDWEIYHRLGDILRSEELAAPLSADFAARMAARLEAEAPHAIAAPAPLAEPAVRERAWGSAVLASLRRFAVPGLAGAAAIVMSVTMGPQWMVGTPDTSMTLSAEASTADKVPGAVMPAASENTPVPSSLSQAQTLVPENDIVRDPRIDQYLMAHQRFSPSVYSSSQFARSATFAAEADK